MNPEIIEQNKRKENKQKKEKEKIIKQRLNRNKNILPSNNHSSKNILKNSFLNQIMAILLINILISKLKCENKDSFISYITLIITKGEHHVYSKYYTSIKPSEITIEGKKQNEIKPNIYLIKQKI